MKSLKEVAVLLFEDFETLDVFGPVEIFGRLKEHYTVHYYSLDGGIIKNMHGLKLLTEKLDDLVGQPEVFLIPGGPGSRLEISNESLLKKIEEITQRSLYVLTVCTGSAIVAAAGLLDDRAATTNKKAFKWVVTTGIKTKWNKSARWVVDGKFYTSSGVSAGMDMSLGFLADRHDLAFARQVARDMEYIWNEDKDHDEFALE